MSALGATFLAVALAAIPILAPTGAAAQSKTIKSVALWHVTTQRAAGALKALTQQVSVMVEQQGNTDPEAAKGMGRSVSENSIAWEILEKGDDYNSRQNSNLCDRIKVAEAQQAAAVVPDNLRGGVQRGAEQYLRSGGDAHDHLDMQLEQRQKVYCSAEEHAADLCGGSSARNEAGGTPAGDTDPSAWMTVRSYGSQKALDGANFIDSVAALPRLHKSPSTARQRNESLAAIHRIRRLTLARAALADVLARGLEGGPVP